MKQLPCLVALLILSGVQPALGQTKKSGTPKKAPTVSAENAPMVGTWTLRDGEKPRKDIRMVFRPNGEFVFAGPNWSSSGKFKLEEGTLKLEWSAVDGVRVAPGTMRKQLLLAEGGRSFVIDRYTYYRL